MLFDAFISHASEERGVYCSPAGLDPRRFHTVGDAFSCFPRRCRRSRGLAWMRSSARSSPAYEKFLRLSRSHLEYMKQLRELADVRRHRRG